MDKQEFYIGWQPKAPLSFAKHIKKILLFLFPAAIIIALMIASFQKRFSAANFEYGRLTTVKGIYISNPVPMLKVINGKDMWGNTSYMTIPLVGYGKHGAATTIKEIEEQKNISLANKEITLMGTLLYGEGRTWMQVNKDDAAVVTIGSGSIATLLPAKKDLGNQTIRGEIIDPKCYFGVMKPGEGKVHRDCAIRCILGGVPPVLKVEDEKGNENFYLLVGENGEQLNQTVQDYVGEPVTINAKIVQQDDWVVLYVKGNNGINRLSKLEIARPGLVALSCGDKCGK